jgi:hypothetical protein
MASLGYELGEPLGFDRFDPAVEEDDLRPRLLSPCDRGDDRGKGDDRGRQ